jgi:hypothetical protein
MVSLLTVRAQWLRNCTDAIFASYPPPPFRTSAFIGIIILNGNELPLKGIVSRDFTSQISFPRWL